jgi:tetratricopeptide (TPR) repeat protein
MTNINAWCLSFILAFTISSPAVAQPSAWSDWRHGVSGHTQALSAAERADDPLVVYFHVDWCPWCRKLNERFLRNGPVRDVLSSMQRVEINPEKGRSEEALFRKYSGKGYPSFYVLVPGSGERPVKLSPFRKSGEQSVSEFSSRIEAAVTGHYDRWAHRLQQGGDHARSLAVLERSLAFNPRNAYAHYLRGLIHHKDGHEQRNMDYLRMAKASYERALALDPGHSGSRKGLEALRKL